MKLKYKKNFLDSICIILLLLLLPTSIYANSSWHWISNSRPIDILPFVIIITLFVEIVIIVKLNKIKTTIYKPIFVVCFANIVSFVVPYLTHFFPNELGMPGYEYFIKMVNDWPSYIVGIGYLFLTLIVEVPIVYYILKNNCDNKKRLLKIVILVNIITTVLVAIVERILCIGKW